MITPFVSLYFPNSDKREERGEEGKGKRSKRLNERSVVRSFLPNALF